MAENNHHHNNHQHHHHHQPLAKASSRLGLRTSGGGGGEIVEVHGGHIVRSTSRKDRHSKVCTAKGPRDRRVRLSAHTAIQFYDVQDRLGYDRPSKAVDWLIKKAKTAIDKLAELPPWKPTATTNPNSTSSANFEQNPDQLDRFEQHPDDRIVDNQLGNSQDSSFLSPSLDSDSIADTIKSFFPVGGSSNPTGNHQDLKLSLQSFQDPILQNHHHHHHQHHHQHHHHRPQTQQDDRNNNVYFDGSGWPENPTGRFQRTVAWGGDAVTGGFVFSSPPAPAVAPAAFLQPLFGQTVTSGLFNNNSQREPLQSSTTTPSFRAWVDPLQPFTGVAIDQHPSLAFHRPFASVPARIRGDEERDGVSGRPSSASSESRH